jgi:K+-transporting ATPase c subunit
MSGAPGRSCLGLIGEPRVNALQVDLDLDRRQIRR